MSTIHRFRQPPPLAPSPEGEGDYDHITLSFLRQQIRKSRDRSNMCLADFIDPDGDWIGGFAVGIHGIDTHVARFKAEHDDYKRHPAEGAGGPLCRSLCRTAAPARAHDIVGLCPLASS